RGPGHASGRREGPPAPGAAPPGQGARRQGCNEMTASGDWDEDMERFALDPDTAARLLSGVLEPEDAPHRYGEVASLLRIAAGPTSCALDGEAAAVTAVVEAIRSSPSPSPRGGARRTGRGTRLKVATTAVVAA